MEEKDFEILEQYLDGKLSPEEITSLELRLQTDKGLSQALEELRMTYEIVQKANDFELKNELNDIHNELKIDKGEMTIVENDSKEISIEPSKKKSRFSFKAIAAAVLLLIGFGSAIYFFDFSSANPEQLYASHYEKMELPSYVRDAQGIGIDPWIEFVDYYENNQFEKALEIQYKMKGSKVPDYLWELYRGICFLSIIKPNAKEALKSFDFVLDKDNDYKDQALWYKTMAALKDYDVDLAKECIDQLNRDFPQFRREEVLVLKKDLK